MPVERLPSEMLEPVEPRSATQDAVSPRGNQSARRDVLLAAVVALNLVTLATLVAMSLRGAPAEVGPLRVVAPQRRAASMPGPQSAVVTPVVVIPMVEAKTPLPATPAVTASRPPQARSTNQRRATPRAPF